MARKRIWKNWEPADAAIPENEREFSGKVIQIVNSDSLSIDNEQGAIKQIFLSSIRPVRVGDLDESIRFKVSLFVFWLECLWKCFLSLLFLRVLQAK